MSGIYAPDGGINITLVSKTDSPVGVYAVDGSIRVCTDSTKQGVYAENGSLRINSGTTTAYDVTGALGGVLSGSTFYPATSGTGGGVPVSQRLMFASTRLHPPTLLATPSDTQLAQISRVVAGLPDYELTEIRAVFVNWRVALGGAFPSEVDTGNSINVRGTLESPTSTYHRWLFGGADNVTIASGGYAISDAWTPDFTTASARCYARTISTVTSGQFRPVGLERRSVNSEGIENAATQADSRLTSGGVSFLGTTGTNNNSGYGPAFLLGKGSDGRAVVLLLGDSAGYGYDDRGINTGTRGAEGAVMRALDANTVGVGRLPFANFAVPGTRPSDWTGLGDGRFKRRMELFSAIRAINGGYDPFTHILSEHCNNSVSLDPATYQAVMQDWWDFLHAQFPSAPIIQTTAIPRTGDSNGAGFSTVADQTVTTENDAPAGARYVVNRFMMGQTVDSDPQGAPPAPLSAVIDWASGFRDPVSIDKFKARSFATTMAADAIIGATSVSLTDAPALYEMLAFGVGSTGTLDIAARFYVTAVAGSGPYTVTLQAALTKAQTAGATVRAIPCRDGTHPAYALYLDAQAVIEAAKATAFT